MLHIEKCTEKYLSGAVKIWNEVVEDGFAFPQPELTKTSFRITSVFKYNAPQFLEEMPPLLLHES